jgi:hypothetical protein
MNDEDYFLITAYNGRARVYKLTKEALLERLNDPEEGPTDFLSDITNDNPNYWGESVVIIKGEIVTPRAVERVVKYEVE